MQKKIVLIGAGYWGTNIANNLVKLGIKNFWLYDSSKKSSIILKRRYPKNINLIESGLFHRFDATNVLKENLASIITTIGIDHLDWLPKGEQTIKKIIFEKTSTLLNSKIIIAKQSTSEIYDIIKNTIKNNYSKKTVFNKDYSYILKEIN